MYSSILAAPSPSMSCRSMSSNSSRSSFENAIAHSSNGYPSVLDPHTTRVRDCPGYDTRAATLNSDDTLLFFTEDDRRSGYAPEHLFANGAVYGESPSYHNPASLRGPHPIYATPPHFPIPPNSSYAQPQAYSPCSYFPSSRYHGVLDTSTPLGMSAPSLEHYLTTHADDNPSRNYAPPTHEKPLRTLTRCEWDGCGAVLDDPSCAGVRRHLKECHFGGNPPSGKAQLPCSWGQSCRRDPMQWENIPKHIAECHLKSMTRTCPKCGGTFARSDTLKRHAESGGCSRPLVG